MDEVVLLSIGSLSVIGSVFYLVLKRIKKRLRKYVLRFEEIENKIG